LPSAQKYDICPCSRLHRDQASVIKERFMKIFYALSMLPFVGHLLTRLAPIEKETILMNLLTPGTNTTKNEPYGEIYSWGWNNMQLGHSAKGAEHSHSPVSPSTTSRTRDVIEPALLKRNLFDNSKVVIVSTGGSHTVIITEDKKIYTFGRNQRFDFIDLI
jgi:alpha-tubulin suppressor-like RCC1 family protein